MKREVAIIGAGDVLERYVSGMDALEVHPPLQISDVIDIVPPEILEERCAQAGCSPKVRVHQIQQEDTYSLQKILGRIAPAAVIISTPPSFHVKYALPVMEKGMLAAIEKPYAAKEEAITSLDGYVEKAGTEKLFLMGYYALERGLPFLVLARGGQVDTVYRDCVLPTIPAEEWEDMRHRLGRLRFISGCLLEGRGRKARLDDSYWVLHQDSGGVTLDLLYHLLCLSLAWAGPHRIGVKATQLLVERQVREEYRGKTGREPAETLVTTEFSMNDTPVLLMAGKYVNEEVDQRWLRAEFEHGLVVMDLESVTMTVQSDWRQRIFQLRNMNPYVTQLRLLGRKLVFPELPPELLLFRSGLRTGLKIREVGLSMGIQPRETKAITVEQVDDIFSKKNPGF